MKIILQALKRTYIGASSKSMRLSLFSLIALFYFIFSCIYFLFLFLFRSLFLFFNLVRLLVSSHRLLENISLPSSTKAGFFYLFNSPIRWKDNGRERTKNARDSLSFSRSPFRSVFLLSRSHAHYLA